MSSTLQTFGSPSRPSLGGTTVSTSESSGVQRVAVNDALPYNIELVQILVGSDNQSTFHIHQSVLTVRSKYFEKALNGKWKESDDRIITLPDEDPFIFGLYINLVYRNLLATKGPEEYLTLCRMYGLAEFLQDVKAKNDITDAIIARWKEAPVTATPSSSGKRPISELAIEQHPSAAAISAMYDRAPEGSMGRKLLLDIYAESGHESWISGLGDSAEEFPVDFMHELVVRLLQVRNMPSGTIVKSRPLSYYHEGDEGDVTRAKEKEKQTSSPSVKRKMGRDPFSAFS